MILPKKRPNFLHHAIRLGNLSVSSSEVRSLLRPPLLLFPRFVPFSRDVMHPSPVHCLLVLALLPLTACNREPPSDVARPGAELPSVNATITQPPAPEDLPASWPTGDAITLALTPAAGATSLTKALYERGDIVLEQAWPDGTQERWWHATDGSTRYVSRDGTERQEVAP